MMKNLIQTNSLQVMLMMPSLNISIVLAFVTLPTNSVTNLVLLNPLFVILSSTLKNGFIKLNKSLSSISILFFSKRCFKLAAFYYSRSLAFHSRFCQRLFR